jgi:hypothetical protein
LKVPKNKWSTGPTGSGVLFVAQLLKEMLEEETFESFRAYSLDTPMRLTEGLVVLRDIRRSRVHALAFQPVKEEILRSLRKDLVANDIAGEHIALFERDALDQKTSQNVFGEHLQTLHAKISEEYKRLCEAKILSIFDDVDQRISLRQATGFYCSHLINLGYSKQFLLRRVEEVFFSRKMQRAGSRTLKSFFRPLDGKKRKYLVCAAVDNEFAIFLKNLKLSDVYATAADVPSRFVEVDKRLPLPAKHSYVLIEREEMDPDSAHVAAMNLLNSVHSLSTLVPNGPQRTWEPNSYVIGVRGKSRHILSGKRLPLNRHTVSQSTSRRALESITGYAQKVLSEFDQNSTGRMLACLRTSGLARASVSVENQLISMWSAVEVLLSEPTDNTARIVHYVNLLLPLICLRYTRRQFIAVYESMTVGYRRHFRNVVSREVSMGDVDQHTRFAAVICLSANNALQAELMQLTRHNPLARHCLFKLQKDFSTPRGLIAALDGHEQRVKWQLHRIYRSRNDLVHSGRIPPYLDSVVVNLDEFFRAAFGTMVNRAGKNPKRVDIDQIAAEIAFEYRMFKDFLVSERKNDSFSLDAVKRIVR